DADPCREPVADTVGRSVPALGQPAAALVHARGDAARHSDCANQDRRAGNRCCRDWPLCGGGAGRVVQHDPIVLRFARSVGARQMGARRRKLKRTGSIDWLGTIAMSEFALTAARVGLASCQACGLLSRTGRAGQTSYCPRCGTILVSRHYHSIQRTWALILAAAICYIPANVLPVL